MEPEPRNLKSETRFSESLARLDFCLGETLAAIEAVQEAALGEMRREDVAGVRRVRPYPQLAGQYHEICETAAWLINLRARARDWGKA